MSDQLSNTETAVHNEKVQQSAYEPEYVVYPPRTGLLRVSYYKKSSKWRPYPTSCAGGLAMIAVTLFSLGLILCQAHSVKNPAILSGAFFFASGLVQIITGIWAVVDNNLFGSVLLLCYGAFFASYGAIITDVLGVQDYYSNTDDYNNALGIYLSAWTVFDFILFTATFKSTIPLVALTFCKWFFMLLYTIATFGEHESVKVASGVFCFLTSVCAFYGVYDGLANAANSYAPLPETKWLRMPGSWHEPESAQVPLV
ncbi:hypothetical protein KL930_000966 [Ogataea haglerorum]|uniref:Uncharacterized protein n=1 Tax=Ogataea haglerorum TaxID=1937702 RepID=A0ABQ7RNB9_9ASCO|nr:uncharacterized protein KL911_001174 [Ogataea haglerorum]KAG7700278.1 hypothetical protein KL915_000967 [Ogataea haglerorum]KAG7701937.1 hypothetical protein KL951_000393 [Ogataea haglerorum]KAG7712522.1 hypothetical protein KL950_000393 [Ogataea haglerorum]KAG7722573.1 hypothetical protein KL913_000393 [Ogataea haglerorum]KAG7723325.1 hypothetical protein KL949_000375 [Ogataea haglerorum]